MSQQTTNEEFIYIDAHEEEYNRQVEQEHWEEMREEHLNAGGVANYYEENEIRYAAIPQTKLDAFWDALQYDIEWGTRDCKRNNHFLNVIEKEDLNDEPWLGSDDEVRFNSNGLNTQMLIDAIRRHYQKWDPERYRTECHTRGDITKCVWAIYKREVAQPILKTRLIRKMKEKFAREMKIQKRGYIPKTHSDAYLTKKAEKRAKSLADPRNPINAVKLLTKPVPTPWVIFSASEREIIKSENPNINKYDLYLELNKRWAKLKEYKLKECKTCQHLKQQITSLTNVKTSHEGIIANLQEQVTILTNMNADLQEKEQYNSYVTFCNENRYLIRQEHPWMDDRGVSHELHKRWNGASFCNVQLSQKELIDLISDVYSDIDCIMNISMIVSNTAEPQIFHDIQGIEDSYLVIKNFRALFQPQRYTRIPLDKIYINSLEVIINDQVIKYEANGNV